MSVRKDKRREGWYYIDYYPNGKKPDPITGKVKREQIPFKGTEEQARAIEIEMRQKHRGITQPIRVNQHIAELWPSFLLDYRLDHAAGTVSNISASCKKILAHFGRYQINSVTQALVDTYKTARLEDGVKPRTINKEIAYFRSFITWAVEKNHAQPLPFQIKGFPKKKTAAPLPIVPSPEEIAALFDALSDDKRVLFRLMYSGGLRRHEACNLCVDRVDLTNGLIFVLGKGSKERVVPIADPALFAELTARVEKVKAKAKADKVKAGYLFPHGKKGEPIKNPRKALKNAATKAGITKRVYNHLLRHCFGSHMTGAGVGLRTLQVTMGHADIKTTTIYTHINLEQARAQMGKFFTPVVKEQPKKRKKKQDVAA